jgi:hypothetical protein
MTTQINAQLALVQDNMDDLRPHERADAARIIGDIEGSHPDDDQLERLAGYAARFE